MREVARVFAVQAVLLDLDGVMVHSAASIERAWRVWSSARGLPWREVEQHVHGRLAVDTIRALLPDLAEAEVEREARAVNDRQVCDTSDVEAVAGMRELVGALPDQSWAIVTACPRDLALARIVAGGYPRPAVLVTFEDVARGKPDPQGYLLAAGKLGAEPSRCLVVEDSPAGVAAARAAGMAVVGLSTTHDATDLRVADAIVPDARWLRVRRASRGMSLTRLTALRSPDTVDERGGVGR